MKLIPLSGKESNGKFAQVDDEDYEYLMQSKWFCKKHRNTFYAYNTKKSTKMHRVIMKIHDSSIAIDHADRDGLNNQKYNLRIATNSQNAMNRKKRSDYKHSKYKGVKLTRNNTWMARISINKKRVLLGSFLTEEDAAFAYNEMAKLHQGSFAQLNILPENYNPSPRITRKK